MDLTCKGYVVLTSLLGVSTAWAADPYLIDCKMRTGNVAKATAAVCLERGGQTATQIAALASAMPSADPLFDTWEQQNRTEPKIAYDKIVVVEESAAHMQAAVPAGLFRDCPECPEMVVIPAGSFDMGSASQELM